MCPTPPPLPLWIPGVKCDNKRRSLKVTKCWCKMPMKCNDEYFPKLLDWILFSSEVFGVMFKHCSSIWHDVYSNCCIKVPPFKFKRPTPTKYLCVIIRCKSISTDRGVAPARSRPLWTEGIRRVSLQSNHQYVPTGRRWWHTAPHSILARLCLHCWNYVQSWGRIGSQEWGKLYQYSPFYCIKHCYPR